MDCERIKTKHVGPKNGRGAWMTRAESKQRAKRRKADEIEAVLIELRDERWATENAREAIREERW